MIIEKATVVAGGLIICLISHILHEFTHLTVARYAPSAGISGVSVYYLSVWFDIPEDTPRRIHEAIGIAPTVVGVVIGVFVVAVFGWPAPTNWNLVAVFAWGLYTYPSPPDLFGHHPPERRDELIHCKKVIQFACLALFGWVIAMIGWGIPLQLFGYGTAVGGVAAFGEALWQWERQPEVARAGA